MTLVHIWASPGLLTLVLTWASLRPGYALIYLGLTWNGDSGPTWASPGRGDWFPQVHHLDLVTQVLIWASWDLVSQFHIGASPGPSDSRPPLGLTLTCDTGPHLDITRTG